MSNVIRAIETDRLGLVCICNFNTIDGFPGIRFYFRGDNQELVMFYMEFDDTVEGKNIRDNEFDMIYSEKVESLVHKAIKARSEGYAWDITDMMSICYIPQDECWTKM